MNPDAELELWRDQWQSSSEAPLIAELRKRVARQSRNMQIMLMGDVGVTLAIGGGAIAWAILDPRVATAILAAAVWLFVATAWIFAILNRRGIWSPVAATTAAFLDLSIRRCRSNLRTTTFGAAFGLIELAFGVAWVFHELSSPKPLALWPFLTSIPMLIVWLAATILLAWLILYRKRKRADLEYLTNLQRELTRE